MIREALTYGEQQLSTSASPALDARLLLQYVIGRDHAFLIAHGDELLAPEQVERYTSLISRATRREPVPYILGQAPFFGRQFTVNPSVLIPRPETELLVKQAISWIKSRGKRQQRWLIDVGTGSGCIAITLALELPGVRIDAIDISNSALDVARQNAKEYGVLGRITFRQGYLLDPIHGSPDVVVANLPYIADPEWTGLEVGVKWYEPEIALRGGVNGLELIERLLRQTHTLLAPDGILLMEIGWQQGPEVRQIAQSLFAPTPVEILPDYSGLDRIVVINRQGTN